MAAGDRSEAEASPDARANDQAVAKRERLLVALARGFEDVAAGRVIELDTEDQIDALFASL